MNRLLLTLCLSLTGSALGTAVCEKANAIDGWMGYLVEGQDARLFSRGGFNTSFKLNGVDKNGMLKRFADALRSRGVNLAVLAVPSPAMVYPDAFPSPTLQAPGYSSIEASVNFNTFLQAFEKSGIPTINVVNLALAMNTAAQPGENSFFFRRDPHWTPLGAHAAADAAADVVKRAFPEAWSKLPTRVISLLPTAEKKMVGQYSLKAKELCGSTYPEEAVPQVKAEISGGSLLDDETIGIVLLGDSFFLQNPDSNFAAYFEAAVQKDVANGSLAGGGQAAAMEEFLIGSLFKETPPAVAIWEFHADNIPSASNLYRQWIPLATGECKAAKQLAHIEASATGTIPLDIPVGTEYLHLNFSELGTRKISLKTSYTVGGEESILLQRHERVRTLSGDWAWELRTGDTAQNTILSVPDGGKGTVLITACKY